MDILISILTTIASYGAELVGIKKNKKNQKRIQYYRMLIFIAVGLLLIYGVFNLYSAHQMRKENFAQKLDEAEYALNCDDYKAAIKLCSEAQDLAYSEETQLAADYFKGFSYFYQALSLQDSNAYRSALAEYRKIIDNCTDTTNYFYLRSVTDSCMIYCYLQYPFTNQHWTELICWLEAFDTDDFDRMGSLDIYAATNLTLAIALYYDRATETQINTDDGIYYFERAAAAYDSTLQLMAISNENSGINIFDDEFALDIVTQFCSKAIGYCRMYYNNSEMVNVSDIESIIDLCENALAYTAHKPITANYISLNAVIGESYWFLAYLESNLESEAEYAQKAYEVLMPLVRIQLEPEYTDHLHFPVSIFAVGSKLCTEDDINDILALYDKGLAKYDATTRSPERLKLLTTACDFCNYYYNFDYPEIPQVREFATEIIEELESMWSGRMTDSDRDVVNELKMLID